MTRVLFVDDEPIVLRSTERMVRTRFTHWEARYVTSGADALDALGAQTFDLVVTDIGMPQMDGVTLLQTVREKFPSVVRFALSGDARAEARFRAVGAVHQWFAKPCVLKELLHTIDRVCRSRALVRDADALCTLTAVTCLPSALRAHADLAAARADGATAEDIAPIVAQDPALCAKLLQLANGAFFDESKPTSCIAAATHRLGLARLWSLLELGELATPSAGAATHQAVAASQRARALESSLADETAVAAILHDVASLALGAGATGMAPDSLARLSGSLLAMWGVPDAIVQAVTYCRDPESAPDAPLLRALVQAIAA
jgi:CheY-like chemotaxis protein